jgi:hypothetical protein
MPFPACCVAAAVVVAIFAASLFLRALGPDKGTNQRYKLDGTLPPDRAGGAFGAYKVPSASRTASG